MWFNFRFRYSAAHKTQIILLLLLLLLFHSYTPICDAQACSENLTLSCFEYVLYVLSVNP